MTSTPPISSDLLMFLIEASMKLAGRNNGGGG